MAKAQVRLDSVVIPVGEVGANTAARWPVEGKIGDELIGGLVHEMNVPNIISDLKLPPVGSKRSLVQQAFIAARQLHPTPYLGRVLFQ